MKFTTNQIRHGSNLSVTSTVSRLTDVTYPECDTEININVVLAADISNTDIVWVGTISTVTAGGTAEATDGMPLAPGQSLEIPINQPSSLYLITSSGTQVVYWMSA